MNIATVFGQRSQLGSTSRPAGPSICSPIYEIPPAEYRARRSELVRRFELEPLLGTAVRKLSLGQRMRCEVAASSSTGRVLPRRADHRTRRDREAADPETGRELNRRGVSVLLTS
jgi:hypothetical protein